MFCAALKLKRKKDATLLFSDWIKNSGLYFGYLKNKLVYIGGTKLSINFREESC